jgi:hypothetical protein
MHRQLIKAKKIQRSERCIFLHELLASHGHEDEHAGSMSFQNPEVHTAYNTGIFLQLQVGHTSKVARSTGSHRAGSGPDFTPNMGKICPPKRRVSTVLIN